MDKRHDTVLETLMEQLIEGGAENMGLVTCPKRPDMMGNPSIPNHWNGDSGRPAL